MACLNEFHCTTRRQSRVFHPRPSHCAFIHPLSVSCRTDRRRDSHWIIFVPRKYKRKQAMCPYNAINPRANTAISAPHTKPLQISKHHTNTNSLQSRKDKKKRPSCSQCKPSSICAWNPFRGTKNIQSTPDQTRSPLYERGTLLTKGTSVRHLAPFAWISKLTATGGRGLSVNVLTAPVRTRNGNCVIYRARTLRRHRRGGSGGRCECPPFLCLTTDDESLG